MKLNIALLTIISAVSALPIIEKRATNNPYLICESTDYNCKSEQSSLCFEKANDCWRSETDYSKCNELNNLCNEIWSYTGAPQSSGKVTTSAKSVQTTTTVKVVPSSTSSAKAIPSSTTSAKAIPSSTTSAKAIPSSTTSAKAIPSSTTSAKAIPSSTTSGKAVPSSTTSAKAIPSSTTASKSIPTSGAVSEAGVFTPTKDNVKIIGRANYDEKGFLWFGLTDSGIEYKFTGKSTTISINAEVNAGNPVRYYIYADGKLYADDLLKKESSELSVDFDESAEHVVNFIKISECANGTVRITGIKADGKIEPTASASKKIEFIGDSITCAYGVDGKDTDTFSTTNENGAKSYAYLAAKKLNADYSMFSFSGFGIISGYSTDGERNTQAALPQYYDKLGFSYWNQFGSDLTQMKEVKWDFNEFVPDLIVINLGTNDNSYMNTIKSSEKKESEIAAFVTEYQEFITKIRSAYPDAEILCTLGIMGQELYPQIEEAVSNYKNESGDEKVNVFKFNVQNLSKNGKAVDWHPAYQSHIEAADELVQEIESLYGWSSNSSAVIEEDEPSKTSAASEPTTSSTKTPPPAPTTKVPPTTYLTSKAPLSTTTTSNTKTPPPQTTTKSAPKAVPSSTTAKSAPSYLSSSKIPVSSTTTTAKSAPPVITTKAPPSSSTTTTAKSAPPVITTKSAPVLTTTTTAKSAPPVITTKSAPVLTTTTTAKSAPPVITTKAPPSSSTTTTAKSAPPVITTKSAPVLTTTTTAKSAPPVITTKSAPQTYPTKVTTVTVPSKMVTTTSQKVTTKAVPQSTTSTKAIPQSTTSTKAIPQSTTTTKAVPKSTTTTKAIPKSTTTTKSVPKSTTKTITKTTKSVAPTSTSSSSSATDYYSCEANDWDCKNKMAHLCYEELAACWSQPYTDSLGAECQKINEKCSKIY